MLSHSDVNCLYFIISVEMIFLLYLYNFVISLADCNWSREWITQIPIEETGNVEDS